MSAFLYGVALQLKLDIRSKTMLVSCYFVPLIFFLFMGGIFTSVMPGMKSTLIQSMIVMGVSMGAFTGLPLTLAETCKDGIKKVYKANGVCYWHCMAVFTLLCTIKSAIYEFAVGKGKLFVIFNCYANNVCFN